MSKVNDATKVAFQLPLNLCTFESSRNLRDNKLNWIIVIDRCRDKLSSRVMTHEGSKIFETEDFVASLKYFKRSS